MAEALNTFWLSAGTRAVYKSDCVLKHNFLRFSIRFRLGFRFWFCYFYFLQRLSDFHPGQKCLAAGRRLIFSGFRGFR